MTPFGVTFRYFSSARVSESSKRKDTEWRNARAFACAIPKFICNSGARTVNRDWIISRPGSKRWRAHAGSFPYQHANAYEPFALNRILFNSAPPSKIQILIYRAPSGLSYIFSRLFSFRVILFPADLFRAPPPPPPLLHSNRRPTDDPREHSDANHAARR